MKTTFQAITLVTGPEVEPVTLDEVKTHLRVDGTDHDAQLLLLIKAIRGILERQLGRVFITQTLDVKYNSFAETMVVPRPNLQSVTSIKYLDLDNVEQTLASSVYRVILNGNSPGFIMPDYGQTWPSTYPVYQPITVRIVSGFGTTADDVPAAIRQALKIEIERDFYPDQKLDEAHKMALDRLLTPWRVHRF